MPCILQVHCREEAVGVEWFAGECAHRILWRRYVNGMMSDDSVLILWQVNAAPWCWPYFVFLPSVSFFWAVCGSFACLTVCTTAFAVAFFHLLGETRSVRDMLGVTTVPAAPSEPQATRTSALPLQPVPPPSSALPRGPSTSALPLIVSSTGVGSGALPPTAAGAGAPTTTSVAPAHVARVDDSDDDFAAACISAMDAVLASRQRPPDPSLPPPTGGSSS